MPKQPMAMRAFVSNSFLRLMVMLSQPWWTRNSQRQRRGAFVVLRL